MNKVSQQKLVYATAAVLLGDPSIGSGYMVQALELLTKVFSKIGLHTDAKTAEDVQASYSLDPLVAATVEKAVATLANRYNEDARWAADTVREKLSNTLKKKRR